MERELVELFEAAKKAADSAAVSSGPTVDRCLDVLNQLKNYPVTYDVLVSTQVAKRLRHLAKHPAGQIQKRVSDVLEIWKKIIISEATTKKNDGIDITSSKKTEVTEADVKLEKVHTIGSIKVEKVSKTETVKTEKIEEGDLIKPGSVSRSETIKVEKKLGTMDTVKAEKIDWSKTVKVEKIAKEEKQASSTTKPSQVSNAPPKLTSLIKCNDAIRDKIRELLLEALSKVSEEVDEDIKDEVDACDPIRVAVAVESVMFDKMGRSNGAQKVKYRSIMFNLKDSKNPDLRRKVLLGQVKPEWLINMTPDEMASDERQRENEHIKKKALFDCERGGPPKATTNQFRCGRCGQRKCTYYQLQTRSADEPMTTFVTCVNCNNRWKFC
ncbi:transcription elongation factor TFIIS-like [Actinidia eriantha]|uniref:transcription elongation factor TFIIS-like n=1 Tax=Actinidia eriantha TaxID=165200 RepID=UPI00258BE482|nr:transcription elongation factor TFIIS-like [Actinidia eriantha]